MFDYDKFDAQCATMNTQELIKQHKHYTRLSAAAMTGTAVSALTIIPTLGLSGVGILGSAPAHHMAKKKKLIVEKYLKARGVEASQAAEYANPMQQQQQQQQYPNGKRSSKRYESTPIGAASQPPPAYSEALNRPAGYTPSQAYVPLQQGGYDGGPQAGWGQAQPPYQGGWGGAPAPQGYASPPMGYGQPQAYGYNQPGVYPQSAMYQPHPNDGRHVHFAT